ncbi:MAG: hypothetical protein ACREF1_01830 [Acetobacteraceae bacterium]
MLPMAIGLLLVVAAGGSAAQPEVQAQAQPEAQAQSQALDPNWPCQSIKIDHLSLAQFWGGPPLGKFLSDWTKYPAAAALAQKLAQRRVPIADANAQIKAFARAAGADRNDELLAFVGGLFSLLDQERLEVIEGLDHFGSRQQSYASQIRAEGTALEDARDAPNPDQKKVQTLANQVYWDMHVFDQRRSMISYACSVPDEIEHRLFTLAGTAANLLP